ncbi:MAG: family 10 glycosylhydrolase, partial [Prevotellaceae bacterium]|nr:family 10 glycosylhydrolase [Prevotellaceae bacterium]
MRRTFCLILLLTLSLNASPQTLWGTEECYPKRETRAVWVTTLGGLDWPKAKATSERGREQQKRELCQLMDELKAAGVNTLLFQVRTRGSVLYPSSLEPWDIALTGQYGQDPGYDPLAFAVKQAHLRGLELEAWVVSVPAFKVNVAQRIGSKSLYSTHRSLLVKHEGMYYLDPGEPETASYLASLCEEITRRYDVDGIHLDYIRYPDKAASFPDAASYKKYGNGSAKADWRRGNITRIVREVSLRVKALKPWVRVTCSPVGKYRDTRRASSRGWNGYDAVYQDAKLWLREGLMDELYPMMYFTGEHFYPFLFDWQEDTAGKLIATGLGIYFLSPSEGKDWQLSVITRELHTARLNGLSGQAFFRSAFLTANTKGLLDLLSYSFYAYPALHPARTWTDS